MFQICLYCVHLWLRTIISTLNLSFTSTFLLGHQQSTSNSHANSSWLQPWIPSISLIAPAVWLLQIPNICSPFLTYLFLLNFYDLIAYEPHSKDGIGLELDHQSCGVRNCHCARALHQPRAILPNCHGIQTTDDDPSFVTPSDPTWNKTRILPDIHHVTDRRLPNGLSPLSMFPPIRSLSAAYQGRPGNALIHAPRSAPIVFVAARPTLPLYLYQWRHLDIRQLQFSQTIIR